MNLSPLYAILNLGSVENPYEYGCKLLDQSSSATLKYVQIRSKAALPDQDLFDFCQRLISYRQSKPELQDAKIIINDRVDIALAAHADGVHLGQDDLPEEIARKLLGPGKIIGLSTHTNKQVTKACLTAIDYLALGPIFRSATKQGHAEIVGLETLKEICQRTSLPVVAIGGINATNAKTVYAAGAASVAVVSDLYENRETLHTLLGNYQLAFGNPKSIGGSSR
ncbi:thiamine phosphate synthase [bacterium]|nr:thiamine phosphate synthase [bacterium]